MIINGKDKGISEISTNLPDVSEALPDWFQAITFKQITKTIDSVTLFVSETSTTINTQGVVQPLTAQQISIKPEGQRAWRWQMIHCLPDVILKNDDIIVYEDIYYRVMGKTDYKKYGYVQYDIVEGYMKNGNFIVTG